MDANIVLVIFLVIVLSVNRLYDRNQNMHIQWIPEESKAK